MSRLNDRANAKEINPKQDLGTRVLQGIESWSKNAVIDASVSKYENAFTNGNLLRRSLVRRLSHLKIVGFAIYGSGFRVSGVGFLFHGSGFRHSRV